MERERTSAQAGLTAEEVLERAAGGLKNGEQEVKTKRYRQIFRENLITGFNILNVILAILVLSVGSYKNALFMGVIFCNAIIGTAQEIRAKRTIDRLSLIAAPRAHVLRGGFEVEVPLGELVMDDLLCLAAGGQVCADCEVLEGDCEADESLLTGESDAVAKGKGDLLRSGSFVVSGRCRAQVIHVGAENYAAQITKNAKYLKRPNSELMSAIQKIIKVIGFTLIPVGIALFCKQVFLSGLGYQAAVVSTVAALVGMIPEGLVLLTSVVLAVSVLRLARSNALVQELFSIEMLARVDTLCLDKTGTITEGCMEVERLEALGQCSCDHAERALSRLVYAVGDQNPTAAAVMARYPEVGGTVTELVPFSSARKWSGARFQEGETYVLGAGEFVLGGQFETLRPKIEQASAEGKRVLVLAYSAEPFGVKHGLPEKLNPVALLYLTDKIRPSARETLRYFAEQGVTLKVISGDNALTVSAVAKRAGLQDAENCVDATTLDTNEKVAAAAEVYTVFGRVTPHQKLLLVQALKGKGHTVAMTGDGINDVMALKESDCSIAMASGSDAARAVSQIVLLDSDFASMPHIVAEGRRAINNLQRSAALFLTKTMFSTILAFCFLFLAGRYPFQPIQLTLISVLTIGVPSFLLALEPNRERVQGGFLRNVLGRSLPGALTMVSNVLIVVASSVFFQFSLGEISTLSVVLTGFTGLCILWNICRPFTPIHAALFAAMSGGFLGAILFFQSFFSLHPFTPEMVGVLLPLFGWTMLCLFLLRRLMNRRATHGKRFFGSAAERQRKGSSRAINVLLSYKCPPEL